MKHISMELIVYGGGDKVVDYLNAVASIINSPNYRYIIYAFLLISLLYIISSYFSTYKLELHKLIISVILAIITTTITTTVVVTDKRNPSNNNSVDNVPITLAFPACFAGAITNKLIDTFSIAYSTVYGERNYGYTDKSPMFLPMVLKDHLNTNIPNSIYRNNILKYIQYCVAPVITSEQETKLYTSGDIMTSLSMFESKLWTIPTWCKDDGSGSCDSISNTTCYDAYVWLNNNRNNIANSAIEKVIASNHLPVTNGETGDEISLYKQQVAAAYQRFLGTSSIDQTVTILNAAITNILTDGFEQYASQTGNNGYLLSLAVAQARQADSMNMSTWAVLAAEKLSYLKEYLYLIVIAMSPIIFAISIISGFHRILITYFLLFLWLGFWDVANVITETIQYHYLENLQDILSVYNTNVQNITYYASDMLKILNRQIAFGGFISATVTPTLSAAMVFGLDKLTGIAANAIGFGQQAATSAGTSLARGDVSMGNQNMLNDSIANNSKFNLSTWNVSSHNTGLYGSHGDINALKKSKRGIMVDVTTGMDVSSQINSVLQHSKQALENEVNQFASNKAVRDTFNTAYQHSLSQFKGVSDSNITNYSQSMQNSWNLAKKFVENHGYDKKNTYKVAAMIETLKNSMRGYKFDASAGISTGLLGEIVGVEGHAIAGYDMSSHSGTKNSKSSQSENAETVTKNIALALSKDLRTNKAFQKQFTDSFKAEDSSSAKSDTSTAHIFASSKEYQNQKQKLFQAMQSYNKIKSTADSIRANSSIGVHKPINTRYYAEEYGNTILTRVDEAAQAVELGTANQYQKATYEFAKKILGVNNTNEMRQEIDKIRLNKNDITDTAQKLLDNAAVGQQLDGKLNESELVLANFLGQTDILNKREELMKNYKELENNFANNGEFNQIEDKIGKVNDKDIENKVNSDWRNAVSTHENLENKVKEYTQSPYGANKLYGDFGYVNKEKNRATLFEHQKNYNTYNWKNELSDDEKKVKTEKDIKKVNPDTRLWDEQLVDYAMSKSYDFLSDNKDKNKNDIEGEMP